MIKRVFRSRWLDFAIYLALAVLIVLSVYYRDSKTGWINNTILALTAGVVLWYTRETSAMKQEVARQNSLQTRPILILELNDKRLFLKNEGRGPALNTTIEEFIVRFLDRDRSGSTTNEVFEFIPPVFVPIGSAHELKMYTKNAESENRGTASQPDVLFQLGNTINITIRYEDIQGATYKTHMEIRSGMPQMVSFDPSSTNN